MVESRQLKSTVEVINALGGLQGMRELIGAVPQQVHLWKVRGFFPSRYYMVMSRALTEKGFEAPPELWRQVTGTLNDGDRSAPAIAGN